MPCRSCLWWYFFISCHFIVNNLSIHQHLSGSSQDFTPIFRFICCFHCSVRNILCRVIPHSLVYYVHHHRNMVGLRHDMTSQRINWPGQAQAQGTLGQRSWVYDHSTIVLCRLWPVCYLVCHLPHACCVYMCVFVCVCVCGCDLIL